jgi:hypothetical protein
MSDSDSSRASGRDLADIERRRLRALVDADLALGRDLHAHDFQLISPAGDSITKDEYLQSISSGEINYVRWDPEDIDTRVQDDASCLRYRSTIEIIVGGRELGPGRFWHTDFYERRNDRWQVVWSQATEIAS